MNPSRSLTSAEQSLPARPLDTADEAVIAALNGLAGKPMIDLRHAPSAAECERIAATVPALIRGGTAWDHAAGHATRLASVLPAAKSDEMDKALAITELAKAFAAYPTGVAAWTSDQMMATRRFRPVPADIHEAAKARMVQLRAALILAERVSAALAAAIAERQRQEAEAREEAQARAEGRETPSERRARIAAQAVASIRSSAADAA